MKNASKIFAGSGGLVLVAAAILAAYNLYWVAIPLAALVVVSGTVALLKRRKR